MLDSAWREESSCRRATITASPSLLKRVFSWGKPAPPPVLFVGGAGVRFSCCFALAPCSLTLVEHSGRPPPRKVKCSLSPGVCLSVSLTQELALNINVGRSMSLIWSVNSVVSFYVDLALLPRQSHHFHLKGTQYLYFPDHLTWP